MRQFSERNRRRRSALAAQPEPLAALGVGVIAGASFVAVLVLTDAHSARSLLNGDQHGFVAMAALFLLLAGLFAILAFAMEILPDDDPAGFDKLTPARRRADAPRRRV